MRPWATGLLGDAKAAAANRTSQAGVRRSPRVLRTRASCTSVYSDGLNTDVLTELGFVITPGLEDYANDGYQATISAQNLDRIDADVIVFATEKDADREALDAMSTFSSLDAVKNNRSVYSNARLSGAI